ncbi:MAG: hypothetical protein CME06_12095 [Gemmatimonadetes bacterium]|nr:hypothetical protein [Gemmatimonadota bacterium]
MRIAPLLCLAISTVAVAAPIGETRYRLEGLRSFSTRFTSTFADGEHLIRAGTIFQRVALRPYEAQPFELLEFGLPMSQAVDVERYGGALRVIEEEGTLWTPEGDARVRLTEDDRVHWFSLAKAGDFLVCGGHGARFATLRPESGGDLVLIELERRATNAWMMVGDRYGGFHYTTVSSIHSASVDSTGHVLPGDAVYEASDTRALGSSSGLDHVYAAVDAEIVLFRVQGPGELARAATLQQKSTCCVLDLSVWFDAERRVDRVAAVYHDSLFAFEVDEAGATTLLFAEGESSSGTRCTFLESGRLYCADGNDRAWLRDGPSLEQRREIPLFQYSGRRTAVDPNGDGWAVIGSTGDSRMILSYGAKTSACYAGPGKTRVDDRDHGQLALSETHLYSGTHAYQHGELWYYVFERGDSLVLADSVSTRAGVPRPPDWVIERDFLITAVDVFDLTDPGHPEPLGSIEDHLPQYTDVYFMDTRPFPGSNTDMLAAVELSSNDSLSLFRISRESGVERIYSELVGWGGGGAVFDDHRDLLYRGAWGYEAHSVAVYDIRDPYHPVRFYEQPLVGRGEESRYILRLVEQDGILHVSLANAQLFYNSRLEIIPFRFDGERFLPAGASLHAPMFPRGSSFSRGGLLRIQGSDGSALLTYDPPPLPRREECCWSDLGPRRD